MSTEEKQGLKEKIEEKLTKLKGAAEHLNVHLHLGAAEAKDEFEKQKKNLAELVDTVQEKLEGAVDDSEEKVKNIRTIIDELRVQAALGKAETEDALEEQAKNINSGLHKIKQDLSKSAHIAEGKASHFTEETKNKFDEMHTQFDLIRLRTHLGRKEVEGTWEEKKQELSGKLHEFNQKLDKKKDVAEDKWEHFSEEISEAWDHLKRAFRD